MQLYDQLPININLITARILLIFGVLDNTCFKEKFRINTTRNFILKFLVLVCRIVTLMKIALQVC